MIGSRTNTLTVPTVTLTSPTCLKLAGQVGLSGFFSFFSGSGFLPLLSAAQRTV